MLRPLIATLSTVAVLVSIPYVFPGETTLPGIKLSGTYVLVSGEKNGKAMTDEEIKGCRVTFTPERIVGTDKDGNELYAATYKLVVDKSSPYRITMVSVTPVHGCKATGLIEKKGDILTLVYSIKGAPAPTEFKTKTDQHMFVLTAEPK